MLILLHQDGKAVYFKNMTCAKRYAFQYIYEDFIFNQKKTLSSRRNLTADKQSKI